MTFSCPTFKMILDFTLIQQIREQSQPTITTSSPPHFKLAIKPQDRDSKVLHGIIKVIYLNPRVSAPCEEQGLCSFLESPYEIQYLPTQSPAKFPFRVSPAAAAQLLGLSLQQSVQRTPFQYPANLIIGPQS